VARAACWIRCRVALGEDGPDFIEELLRVVVQLVQRVVLAQQWRNELVCERDESVVAVGRAKRCGVRVGVGARLRLLPERRRLLLQRARQFGLLALCLEALFQLPPLGTLGVDFRS
jgi:hypothetical protein